MNYIELINNFWELDEIWQFTCCETRLYFYLVKTANRLGWVNNWTHSDIKISANVGVSVNSMKVARNRLVQAGLIEVKGGGAGYRNKTRYSIRCQNLIPNHEPNPIPNHEPNHTPNPVPNKININKTKKRKNEERNLAFIENSQWKEIFETWLDYKDDRKENYKSEKSIHTCFSRLVKISGNDLEVAKEMIENSISNNYAGLFPLKNHGNNRTNYKQVSAQPGKPAGESTL